MSEVKDSPGVFVEPLTDLLDDWRIHLRAKGRQPATVESYLGVARAFVDYLTANGMPTTAVGIHREHVEHYLADMRERVSAATVATHYRALQQLVKWLADDGESPAAPMGRTSPRAIPEQPVPVLTDDVLRALLDTTKGNTFENRRDEAIIRLFLDTGMRAAELCGLTVDDIDSELSVALVMGK